MRLLFAVTTALVLGGSAANAACNVADLKGTWTWNQTNIQEICGVKIDDEGKIEGTCRTYKGGEVQEAKRVKGKIEITRQCKVSGNLSGDNRTRTFQGRMDSDMNLLVGIFYRRSGMLAYRAKN
jgi:hypothetical protein